MKTYNLKIYYYETGTQFRVYSRPISKKSIMEKEQEQEVIDVLGYNPNDIEKRVNDMFLPNDCERVLNPFTEEIEVWGTLDEDKEKRAKQVSLNRSKQNLIGICRANKWHYFVTFTFNPRLVDSSNYYEVCVKTSQFMNNLRKRYCPNMKYVLVPELHKDGEHYHLHGLMADCDGFKMRVSGKFDRKGNIIYNMPSWKYGWNTATAVSHSGKVSNYIAKYITKDTEGLLHGKRRYWCSHNTILPQEVCDELYVDD